MKRLYLIIFILFYLPSQLCADYIDDKLPPDTSVHIKEGARQIIQLGIKKRFIVKVTKRMLENNFEEKQILSAYDILIKAKEQILSEDLIIDKLNEGIAKEVPPDRIIVAMEKVRARYETANGYAKLLSEDEDHIQTMTTEIAECMAAGIKENDLKEVVTMLQEKVRGMKQSNAETLNKQSVQIMKTMARSGVESQDALIVVTSAFQSGLSAKDMESLENSFNRNARWTASVSDLAKSYAAAIRNGATFDDIDSNDPRATGFGFRMPGSMNPGIPSGGIPPGGIGGNGIPPGAPNSPPSGAGRPGGPPSRVPPGRRP